MGRLIGVGGVCVSGENVGQLERTLDSLCRQNYGFPPGEEFKWSPGRELWMRENLVGDRRFVFFRDVVQRLREAGANAWVVIKDSEYRSATDAKTPEMDTVRMCLERVCNQCRSSPPEGLVITDRAIGGYSGEDKFLSGCLEDLQSGSGYLRPDALALNVLSTPSKFVRLLQAADLVTGATLAAVAGEFTFSLPVVNELKSLYRTAFGRIGGYGVKIHPDYKYANLYHWIFGDTHFVRFNVGRPLPMSHRPYATDSNVP